MLNRSAPLGRPNWPFWSGALVYAFLLGTPAMAQLPGPVQAGADAVARDQARRAAEAAAAARSARQDAPQSRIEERAPVRLGAFPVEQPCFPIRSIIFDPAPPPRLRWIGRALARFEGRCVGREGLDYILKTLQADFLDRGLVTTRAGLPEQDLSTGVLRIAVVPGVEAGVRGGSAKDRRAWAIASPIHSGDLINLRALEQGLDQMRRVPGREVSVDLSPGAAPGESYFDLRASPAHPVFGSVSVNNFAGTTVGRWQASGTLGVADLLGLNEVLSGFYNSRLDSPAIPANSTGFGGGLSVPYGWWTLSLGGSVNRYRQQVIGQVQSFETRSRLSIVSGTVDRVIHRDRVSRTSLAVQLQRRWSRSYIDDVEIGLQHQDLTDVQLALLDRRRLGRVQFDSAIAGRVGVGLLGAQKDEPDQPAALPSARYKILTIDLGIAAPLGGRLGYRSAFRAQLSDRALFGSDLFSVGGPYTVRGYEADRALIGRSGLYWRQELSVRVIDAVQPYLLADIGHVRAVPGTPLGLGAGLRAQFRGASLDAFVAAPVTARSLPGTGRRRGQVGVSVGFAF